MASKSVDIIIKAKDAASGDLKKIGKNAEKARVSAAGLGKAFLAVGAGAVAAGAMVFRLAKSINDAKNQLQDASKRTGIAASTLNGLKLAAESSGQTFQNMDRVLRGFSSKLAGVQRGTAESVEAFDNLGVKTHDVNGNMRSADAIFKDTIAALSGMSNVSERNAAAINVFGSNAGRLFQALGSGEGALRKHIEFSEKYGIKTGPEAAKASANWQAATARFANVMPGIIDQLAGKSGFGALPAVISTITGAVLGLAEVVPTVLRSMFKPFLKIGEVLQLLTSGEIVKAILKLDDVLIAASPIGVAQSWWDFGKSMQRGATVAEQYMIDADALDRSMSKQRKTFEDNADAISAQTTATDKQADATKRAGSATEKAGQQAATAVIITRPLWVLLEDINDALPEFSASMNQAAADLENWARAMKSAVATDAIEGLMALATGDIGAFLGRLSQGEKPLISMATQAAEAFKASIHKIVFALPAQWASAISGAFDKARAGLSGVIEKIGSTKIGSAIGGAVGGLSTGIAAVAGPAGAALSGLSALGSMTTASGEQVTSGQGAAAVVGDQLEQLQDSIMIGLEALPVILGEVLPAFLPKLVQSLVEAIPALIGGLLKATPKLAKAFMLELPIAILKGVKQWFIEVWSALKQWFSDLFNPMRRAAEKDLASTGPGVDTSALTLDPATSMAHFRALQAAADADGFQQGARYIDRTQRSLLHRGEQVVPRGGVATHTNARTASAAAPSIVINSAVVDGDVIPRLIEQIEQVYSDFGRGTSPLFSGA